MELNEVVTEREAPVRKAWETVDARLLVIGQYRLGFALQPDDKGSTVRVFIDYALPEGFAGRLLGRLFGGFHARLCTRRIASDAVRYLQSG